MHDTTHDGDEDDDDAGRSGCFVGGSSALSRWRARRWPRRFGRRVANQAGSLTAEPSIASLPFAFPSSLSPSSQPSLPTRARVQQSVISQKDSTLGLFRTSGIGIGRTRIGRTEGQGERLPRLKLEVLTVARSLISPGCSFLDYRPVRLATPTVYNSCA